MARIRGALTAALIASALLPAYPAVASCAEGSGAAGSPVVFVGTAEEERRGYTRFRVDQVWAGPDLAPEVWVLSGQRQPPWPLGLVSAVGSSSDADFVPGEQYVVGASRSFGTGACSVSDVAGTEAPAEVRGPAEDGTTGADPPTGPLGLTMGAAALAAGVTAVAALVRRRRAIHRTASS